MPLHARHICTGYSQELPVSTNLKGCGYNRAGSMVQWLTQWPVTVEAIGVLTPAKRDALFVQWINHVPLAGRFAGKAEIVAWGGRRPDRDCCSARGPPMPIPISGSTLNSRRALTPLRQCMKF
jgi:hypothetical protein